MSRRLIASGAFASRQTVTAGNAAHRAAEIVAEKVRKAAAAMLEVAAQWRKRAKDAESRSKAKA